MKHFFSSLNRKMVVFLILVLGTSLGISSFFSIRSETSHNLRLARERVQSFVEALQANMFRAMIEGKCEEIPVVLRALTSQKEFRMARIFSPEGKVIESTEDGEKGKLLDISDLLQKQNQGGILTRSPKGEKIFRVLSPFYNQPKCSRCHGEGGKVRAYLAVDLSLTSFEHQIESHNAIHFVSDFCVLLMICAAMLFFFSRFVNRPIIDVSRKMSELEKGNFDVQVPVKTQDEVGHLARSFNFMVMKLNEMRKKEGEQQNLLLNANEDLRGRIKDLNVLYEASQIINRSLQVEEILKLTIENVTKSLGFDRVVLTVFDEQGEILRGKWSIGIDKEIVQKVRISKEDIKGVLCETLEKREPVMVKDTSAYPFIEETGTQRCWEVLECHQEDCPIFHGNELRCWMVTGTRCHREMKQETFEEKMRICGKCSYLNEEIIKRSDIVNLLLFGSRSFVSVPLIASERVLGILLADKLHSERKEITEEDVKLLMTFISHVSVAIENAVLYQRLGRKVDLSQRQLEESNEQLKQKIDELNEIRSFNESILQNLYGGIVSYNNEGTITFINRPGAKLLGWEESEVLGGSIDDVLGNGGREPSFFHKRLEGDGDLFSETEVPRRGGGRIPIEVFLSYLRDSNGKITGVTGIFRDITEKKEIEARMHRIDKLASLGQLASGIAHEIKNPLAGIGSAIQVLSSSLQRNDTQKKVFKEILNQIHRLDGTVKNMLSFARPGQLKLAPTDPNEVIEAVIFLVRQQVKKQNVEIHLDLGKDLRRVMIDPQQIQQAVLNVVLNAVEAMTSGGILTISTREKVVAGPTKKESPYMSIVVSDTGSGIPEKTLAQIFNPFYTTKPAGTGLGLSITQRIIEEHHGKIDIRSEAGKGTSFIIDLPV